MKHLIRTKAKLFFSVLCDDMISNSLWRSRPPSGDWWNWLIGTNSRHNLAEVFPQLILDGWLILLSDNWWFAINSRHNYRFSWWNLCLIDIGRVINLGIKTSQQENELIFSSAKIIQRQRPKKLKTSKRNLFVSLPPYLVYLYLISLLSLIS